MLQDPCEVCRSANSCRLKLNCSRYLRYQEALRQQNEDEANVKMSGANSYITAMGKKYGCAIIAPRRSAEPKSVWVAYSSKKPNLPECVEDSAQQLAAKCGVSERAVRAYWSRYSNGKAKFSRFHRVYID